MNLRILAVFGLVLSILLLGCVQQAPAPTPAVVTVEPTATPAPTVAPTVVATPAPTPAPAEGYYAKLSDGCKQRANKMMLTDGGACCRSSVEAMKAGGYRASEDATCPAGTGPETVRCPGAYMWCIPLPSPSAGAAATPSIPALPDFAKSIQQVSNKAFNDTRPAYESAPTIWVIDNTLPDYKYTLFIKAAKASSFSSFDPLETLSGKSGLEKKVSVVKGTTGPYYQYHSIMKCYNARYDVELDLYDFIMNGSEYRRTLGPTLMPSFIDVCPN